MIVSGFFNYNNNSGLHMLCIYNSHFLPSAIVIFANIYIKLSLLSSAYFYTDNSRLPTISSTHSLFSALPHNHIPQPVASSSCPPRHSPTFQQALPSPQLLHSSFLYQNSRQFHSQPSHTAKPHIHGYIPITW